MIRKFKEVKFMDQNYGSVITEQGDLGLGITPIHESESDKKDKETKKDK